ncbi:MAG: putative metal-binding motif-containing protein [Candidatus Peribacteria bacterium]|nr:MAG: putative metal-binding motif-containing protein [Candidatus Peribacteria bacterium]
MIGGGDCANNEPLRFPGNAEVCDGLDNDCNMSLPVGEQDVDGDHYVACSFVS